MSARDLRAAAVLPIEGDARVAWRTCFSTDGSAEPTGIAPVCLDETHDVTDGNVYGCCREPVIETGTGAMATYLVDLLRRDGQRQGKPFFFQPGRTQQRGRWTFRCLAVQRRHHACVLEHRLHLGAHHARRRAARRSRRIRLRLAGVPRTRLDPQGDAGGRPDGRRQRVDHLHEGGAPVDAALETQAKSAGDEYVDTYTFTIGHDMCQPDAAKRWIEPLDTKLKPAHPNSTGQVAMYWELYPKLVSQS